jgi:hypothetical protein
MTVLTRFEPFREFSTLQERMNRSVPRVFQAGDGREEALSTNTHLRLRWTFTKMSTFRHA